MNTSSPSDRTPRPDDFFATTRWTVVLSAGKKTSPQCMRALEELCQTYWYPLYAYVRGRGYSKEDAEDLTQAFFARFLDKNNLEGLSSDKGKFRAFLLASLKHFLANEWDKSQRQKRGGQLTHLSLNWQDANQRFQFDPADELSPDKLYYRTWAVTLLERVLGRLKSESKSDSKVEVFDYLKAYLTVDKGSIPYATAAESLSMSESAVRVTVHRLRRRYRELLRDEIAQTLSDPNQLDEELRALMGAFG